MPFRQLKSFLKILIGVQYQSPSVTALPEGEPRGCTSARKMERIGIDTLHSLFYDHPADRWVIFPSVKRFPLSSGESRRPSADISGAAFAAPLIGYW